MKFSASKTDAFVGVGPARPQGKAFDRPQQPTRVGSLRMRLSLETAGGTAKDAEIESQTNRGRRIIEGNGSSQPRMDANEREFDGSDYEITHESQIRKRPHRLAHDPAKAPLPGYHPDTPEVRRDWAQYYDNITTLDGQVAQRLKELDDDGLAEDTIVFFFGDHGSGMPRSKRWPYNSGLHVPLIVHVPQKWRHLAPPDYQPGGRTDRLVSFAALAEFTARSLALKLGQVAEPSHVSASGSSGSSHCQRG